MGCDELEMSGWKKPVSPTMHEGAKRGEGLRIFWKDARKKKERLQDGEDEGEPERTLERSTL